MCTDRLFCKVNVLHSLVYCSISLIEATKSPKLVRLEDCISETYLVAIICQKPNEIIELDNLVWSITAKLKNVRYRAYYEPLKDPDVLIEFEKLLHSS